MLNKVSSVIQDFTYDEYQHKQLFEVTEESILKRVAQVKPAKHFAFKNNTWEPHSYEGAAVVSMLSQSSANVELISRLAQIQDQLKDQVEPHSIYFLPTHSFHQTIANTLSTERFQKNIVKAGLEDTYPSLVQHAFAGIPTSNSQEEISMKMVGLSLFGTALGMLGVFENVDDYRAITQFRSSFYSNAQLNSIDVKMTRPFIGHVTLAYIESEWNEQEQKRLSDSIIQINQYWQHNPSHFHISYTELRRYHHLAEFIKPINYPSFIFCKA